MTLLSISTDGLPALKRCKAWKTAASGYGAQRAPRLPRTGLRVPRPPLLAAAPAALLVPLLALLSLVALLALVAYRVHLTLLAAAKAALLAALLALLSLVALLTLVAYRVREPAEHAEDMRASLLWCSIFGTRAQTIAPSSAGPAEVLRLLVAYPHGCLLYTSPSPRDRTRSRMPSSA